jgi:hypothetical protein
MLITNDATDGGCAPERPEVALSVDMDASGRRRTKD